MKKLIPYFFGAALLSLLLAMLWPAQAQQSTLSAFMPTTPALNVRTMGAKGGIADDTTIFQTALNTGGRVYVPPDTNYTTGTLYVTNNTYIFGLGSKISLLSTVSNAAHFDWKQNTNIVMDGLVLDGGAYNGDFAPNGTTNRQAIAPYTYGQGSKIINCTIYGYDYGIRPTGDKTGVQSHQLPTVQIRDVTCYSNFAGLYFLSPDANHVVEYITVTGSRFFFNTEGVRVDSGNINLVANDVVNNKRGITIPGTGQNIAHSVFTGNKIHHQVNGAFLFTNATIGQDIIGNAIFANGDSYFSGCQGIQFIGNTVSAQYFTFAGGSVANPHYFAQNTIYGVPFGGLGGFTLISTDGTVQHKDNKAYAIGGTATSGDYEDMYRTNVPSVQDTGFGDLDYTNAFAFANSNGNSVIYCYINNGTGTRVDRIVEASSYGIVSGSDATTTGTTLTDVTGLSVPLEKNGTFEFSAVLACGTSADTTGTKYGVQYSAAGASVEASIQGPINATTAVAERISALNTANATALLTVSGQSGGVEINGIVTTGANAGNLTIQHLKVTSGTSTVRQKSFLKAKRIK